MHGLPDAFVHQICVSEFHLWSAAIVTVQSRILNDLIEHNCNGLQNTRCCTGCDSERKYTLTVEHRLWSIAFAYWHYGSTYWQHKLWLIVNKRDGSGIFPEWENFSTTLTSSQIAERKCHHFCKKFDQLWQVIMVTSFVVWTASLNPPKGFRALHLFLQLKQCLLHPPPIWWQ